MYSPSSCFKLNLLICETQMMKIFLTKIFVHMDQVVEFKSFEETFKFLQNEQI